MPGVVGVRISRSGAVALSDRPTRSPPVARPRHHVTGPQMSCLLRFRGLLRVPPVPFAAHPIVLARMKRLIGMTGRV